MADGEINIENDAVLSSSNHLLDCVPLDERARMNDRLEPVQFDAGHVLYEPGDRLTHVYLPLTGMISLVAVMSDGRAAEGMTIGREGAAALSASGYVDAAFTRFVVQLPGSGYRIKAEDFEDLVNESVAFCSAVTRWREVMIRMSLQSVACNALHSVRQRLARWILTTHDRTETDRLPLTQEFLAIMLGVKRNAVSIVARDFLDIGAIEYRRGNITVINPDLLKSESCECYARIRGEISLLFSQRPRNECEK